MDTGMGRVTVPMSAGGIMRGGGRCKCSDEIKLVACALAAVCCSWSSSAAVTSFVSSTITAMAQGLADSAASLAPYFSSTARQRWTGRVCHCSARPHPPCRAGGVCG